jgi:hypothetical protein
MREHEIKKNDLNSIIFLIFHSSRVPQIVSVGVGTVQPQEGYGSSSLELSGTSETLHVLFHLRRAKCDFPDLKTSKRKEQVCTLSSI